MSAQANTSTSAEAELTEANFILIGDGEVGKTSLCNVYTGRPFNDDHIMTMGVDYVKTRKMPSRLA